MTIAFIPAAPLLVPEVGAASRPDIVQVRAAAVEAAPAGGCVVVALGSISKRVDAPVLASLAPLGMSGVVGSPGGSPVGWQSAGALWIADEAGAAVQAVVEVGADDIESASALLAAALDGGASLLVAADGSAGLGPKAPGHIIEGAAEFDDRLAAALAAADAHALAELDRTESVRVACVSGPVWEAVGRAAAGRDWSGSLLLRSAPLGVAYLVARWSVSPSG